MAFKYWLDTRCSAEQKALRGMGGGAWVVWGVWGIGCGLWGIGWGGMGFEVFVGSMGVGGPGILELGWQVRAREEPAAAAVARVQV